MNAHVGRPGQLVHRTVRTADQSRLAVQILGRGPALLLLPGQANNHRWWNRTRGDFAVDRMTVTFDYRGTGRSDATRDRFSTRQLAQDALAVLDSLGIASADVYGTSMGGKVATWIAADAPQVVNRLVLGCTSPGGPHSVDRSIEIRRMLSASSEPSDVLADLMYTPHFRAAHPGPHGTLGDAAMTQYARIQHLRASDDHNAWDVLPDIDAPTLILHGTDDLLTPPVNAELLARRIPNARLHLFPGARHAYFEECRPAASDAVLAFLRKVETGG